MRGWCYTSCILRSWKFWMFWVGSGVVRYMERGVRRMRNSVYILRALWYSFWWYLHPTAETFKQLVYSYHDHARQAYFRDTHTHTHTHTTHADVTRLQSLQYCHTPTIFSFVQISGKKSALYIQHISLSFCFVISTVAVLSTLTVFVTCQSHNRCLFLVPECSC